MENKQNRNFRDPKGTKNHGHSRGAVLRDVERKTSGSVQPPVLTEGGTSIIDQKTAKQDK